MRLACLSVLLLILGCDDPEPIAHAALPSFVTVTTDADSLYVFHENRAAIATQHFVDAERADIAQV
ncbi:MAG: hypothetical protein AAGJ10_21310, partial [Bacteroidota bacterium]